ncbi:LacI family DNA-binding transcriptional regulator [Humidisolicoccus flavus]|uniref:LacI family DNA-binding transcriptional regulator n=1 Tax=Humidisolicoccus flavus TaxID=3111414 RepID=UPI003247A6AD
MAPRIKLSDVAEAAGVSLATASRVLNNNGKVDPELASRVLAETERLGYRQNSLARGLRRRANTVVGAVIPDITNPFFTDLVRGVEDVVREHGYLLVLGNSDETPEKEERYLRVLLDQQIAGLVIAPVQERSGARLAQILGDTPVVAVDRKVAGAGFDTVSLDNVAGAAALTTHLLQRSRDIATIAGPSESTTGRERLAGFRDALAQSGAKERTEWIMVSDYSEQGGYAAAHELFAGTWRPGALFAANNAMALGALRAMGELGITHRDVAMASFDPLSWSADPGHQVATLAVPSYEMGREAARLLMLRVSGKNVGDARTITLSAGAVRA